MHVRFRTSQTILQRQSLVLSSGTNDGSSRMTNVASAAGGVGLYVAQRDIRHNMYGRYA